MAVELASAYISLVPSARNITGNLRREIEGPAREAGRKAGQALEDGLEQGAERGARNAGTSITSLIGSAAVIGGIGKVTQAASGLQQAVGATGAVFQEAAGQIDEFAEGAAETVGLSERAAREATASVGALLKGFGASAEDAAGQAIQLTEIGADLAATFGGTTKDAVDALTAALRGEGDPAERFGISLRAASIEAKAVELGLVDAGEEVDAYSKSQAAMALILEQTTDAQGQFARESGSAAGSAQIAAAQMEDSAADFGEAVLPLYAQAAELAGKLAQAFAALPESAQTLLLLGAGGLAVASPIRSAFEAARALGGASRNAAGGLTALGKAGVALGAIGIASMVYEMVDSMDDLTLDVEGLAQATSEELVVAFQRLDALGLGDNFFREMAGGTDASRNAARDLRDELQALGYDTAELDTILRTAEHGQKVLNDRQTEGAGTAAALGAGVDDAAGEMAEATEEIGTFAERVEDAFDAVSDLLGVFSSQEEAHIQFREGIRAAWREVEQLNEQNADLWERRDAFTQFLLDQRDAALLAAEAMDAQGATAEDTIAETQRLINEAAAMGDEFGLSRGQVDALRESLGLTDGTIAHVLIESNIGQIAFETAALNAALRDLRSENINFNLLGAGARAEGGPVSAGVPYIVGEKRAELFVPASNGYIVPEVPDSFGPMVGSMTVVAPQPEAAGPAVVRALRREKILSGAVR